MAKNIGTLTMRGYPKDTVWNIQLMDKNDPMPEGLLERIAEQAKEEEALREEMKKLAEGDWNV